LYDDKRDTEYDAWSCINNEEYANRIIIPGSKAVVFAINATDKLNNTIALSLEQAFIQRKIELLIGETDAKEMLSTDESYLNEEYSAEERAAVEMPYYETDFLIHEMVNLQKTTSDNTGYIKLKEPSNGRKDRYSSFSYGNYYIDLLERELINSLNEMNGFDDDDDLVLY